MDERDYRPAILVAILVMLCLIVAGVLAHFLVRRAVRDLIAQQSEKQLLADALSIRNGQALRPLRGDPNSVNRKLLATLNRV